MCDYSLQNVVSRPGKIGDQLVTTRFANTRTRGFAEIGEPEVAVCLLPGTEIGFDSEVEYRKPIARLFSGFVNEPEHRKPFARLFSGLRVTPGKVARFRHINLDDRNKHHDALEFADGTIVLLTFLCPGQRATILQLPAAGQKTTQADDHERPAVGADPALAR